MIKDPPLSYNVTSINGDSHAELPLKTGIDCFFKDNFLEGYGELCRRPEQAGASGVRYSQTLTNLNRAQEAEAKRRIYAVLGAVTHE